MDRRPLPLGWGSCPPQVSPRCPHPPSRCLSSGERPPASPGGAPFAWRVGGGDRRRWGAGTGWHTGQGWGWVVPACRGGISLTTLSTCAPGSWASSWGSGKPVRTPRTAKRCPGPCQERGATQSWVRTHTHSPATAAMHPSRDTHSPQQHPIPCPRDAHPEPSGAHPTLHGTARHGEGWHLPCPPPRFQGHRYL